MTISRFENLPPQVSAAIARLKALLAQDGLSLSEIETVLEILRSPEFAAMERDAARVPAWKA